LPRLRLASEGLRDAEIQDLHGAIRRDGDIGRLEVSVDHTGCVGRLQRGRDLLRDRDRLVRPERPPGEMIGQRVSLDELEDENEPALVQLHVVDGGDVRVAEGREDPGFLFEPGGPAIVTSHLVRERLECHVALESDVESSVHAPHTPRSDRLQDPVVSDRGTGEVGVRPRRPLLRFR
jgi:hypothetical protein